MQLSNSVPAEIRHFEYFCVLFVVVFLTYGGTFVSARVENNIKYNQDHIIVLLLEHNFRLDAV